MLSGNGHYLALNSVLNLLAHDQLTTCYIIHSGANLSYFVTISQTYSVHVLQPINSFHTAIKIVAAVSEFNC